MTETVARVVILQSSTFFPWCKVNAVTIASVQASSCSTIFAEIVANAVGIRPTTSSVCWSDRTDDGELLDDPTSAGPAGPVAHRRQRDDISNLLSERSSTVDGPPRPPTVGVRTHFSDRHIEECCARSTANMTGRNTTSHCAS